MDRSPGRRILNLLDEIRDHYGSLLDRIKDKNQAVIDRDVKRLSELNDEQQALVEQIQQLNRDRAEFWERALSDHPGDRRTLPVDELVEAVPGLTQTEFEKRKSLLKQVLRDVQRHTQENMVLLENRLSVFENLFTALSGEGKPRTYDRGQNPDHSRTGSSVMIDREI